MEFNATLACEREDLLGRLEIGIAQRFADVDAGCSQKRVAHPAADAERVDLADQIREDADLISDLRAADGADEGLLRIFGQLRERGKLGFHQQTGCAREKMSDAFGRGVRAMCCAEGVVDVTLGERRKFLGEVLIVLFFFRVEAHVFEQ